jgi:N-methylhydantoinase B
MQRRAPIGNRLSLFPGSQCERRSVMSAGQTATGDPLERPAEHVLRDITSGYVSVEAARRDYGVMIKALGRHFTLDVEATEARRREMAGKKE